MALIYVADDDANICNLIKKQLESDGFETEIFLNGKDLLEKFQLNPCDLILTDIMMPEMGGYDLCKAIRISSTVPVIMISAKDEEIDMVIGLEIGADDYISKPFSLRALSVKCRNMLRRYNNKIIVNENILTCRDLAIDLPSRKVLLSGEELEVTAKEYDLLVFLLQNKNQAFSRDKLIESVWGYDYLGDSRQVDHMIKRLRKKLLLFECDFQIKTIWGYGYKVEE